MRCRVEKVSGNTGSVKRSVVEYLESFPEHVFSPGEFLPPEIAEMLLWATCETKKEIAVFLDRKNRVVSVGIGDASTVSLPESVGARRGDRRLCGVRLWHTHPGGSPYPSDVDLNSLKTMRLDGMGVVAVDTEKGRVTGLSVSVLSRDEKSGLLSDAETVGPYGATQRQRFNALFEELGRIDASASDFTGHDSADGPERAIVAGVLLPDDPAADGSLAELSELAKSAGATVVGAFTQRRAMPDPKYYIGRGFAEELALKRQALHADLVIFDDELSASCIRNLEETIGTRVIDRTSLILDIFALRAKSREGRLQVELAQQKYRLPRLTGQGTALSRLGGGIGTRGPGETKLQSDRMHIRRRIRYLEQQLQEVSERRNLLRKERTQREVPVVAVVGYTNAGKSTLVNKLCASEVFAEDMLFATLDTSVRRLVTEDRRDFLLVDTVGFIRKLPHELIEAFKSTLEEAVYADLLLHVVDGSSPEADIQIETVEKILDELGAGGKPQLLVVNKTDRMQAEGAGGAAKKYPRAFYISAVTGEGLDALRDAVTGFFAGDERTFEELIPYSDGKRLSYLHENGTVLSEEYREDGVYVKGRIRRARYGGG